MTLQQLVYAVKIADTKSMNKAAAELLCIPAGTFQYDTGSGRRIEYRIIYPNQSWYRDHGGGRRVFKLCKTDGRTESDDRRSIYK